MSTTDSYDALGGDTPPSAKTLMEDLFKTLHAIPDELSNQDRAKHYALIRVQLLTLRTMDKGLFSFVAKDVCKKFKKRQREFDEEFTELEEPLDSEPLAATSGRGPTQAQQLVGFADGIVLWQTDEGEAWVTIQVDEHKEHSPVRSSPFRLWLSRQYYLHTQRVASDTSLKDAIATLEGKALFEGETYEVYVRIAEHESKLYIDLGNPRWEAVEISATGWRIVSDPPVRFRRGKGMLALPHPQHGGSLALLKPFLNLPREYGQHPSVDWILILGWVLSAFLPCGPFPLLVIGGGQGSTKSTLMRVLRKLIDPAVVELQDSPHTARDLAIQAKWRWILAFDNLSTVPPWLSDALCRLATGSGLSTRELFSDDGEMLFKAVRAIMLNAIEHVVTRADLGDRSLPVFLPELPKKARRMERKFWRDFEEQYPLILGALYDTIACMLRDRATITIEDLPRMADAFAWMTAAEPSLGWEKGTFIHAFEERQWVIHETVLGSSAVGLAIQRFMQRQEAEHEQLAWTGTATALLGCLNAMQRGDGGVPPREWPHTPVALANSLRRLQPTLVAAGIRVDFERHTARTRERLIRLQYEPSAHKPSSAPDAPSMEPEPQRHADDSDKSDDSDAHLREFSPLPPQPSDNTDKSDDSDARGQGFSPQPQLSEEWEELS